MDKEDKIVLEGTAAIKGFALAMEGTWKAKCSKCNEPKCRAKIAKLVYMTVMAIETFMDNAAEETEKEAYGEIFTDLKGGFDA